MFDFVAICCLSRAHMFNTFRKKQQLIRSLQRWETSLLWSGTRSIRSIRSRASGVFGLGLTSSHVDTITRSACEMGKRRNLRNPTCLSRFQQISATVFPELGRKTIEVAPGLDSDDDDEEDDIPNDGIQPGLQTPSMFLEKPFDSSDFLSDFRFLMIYVPRLAGNSAPIQWTRSSRPYVKRAIS